MEIVTHPTIPLTRAYHPMFVVSNAVPTLAGLQKAFHGASELLAEDNDKKYADDNPLVATNHPFGLYLSDDAPAYVHYIITDFTGGTNANPVIFPPAIRDSIYFNVKFESATSTILSNAVANISQVNSINYGNSKTIHQAGVARYFSNPPRIVLLGRNDADTVAHEYLHTLGVHHRQELITNNFGVVSIPNPGPITNAVMAAVAGASQKRINRLERNSIPVR